MSHDHQNADDDDWINDYHDLCHYIHDRASVKTTKKNRYKFLLKVYKQRKQHTKPFNQNRSDGGLWETARLLDLQLQDSIAREMEMDRLEKKSKAQEAYQFVPRFKADPFVKVWCKVGESDSLDNDRMWQCIETRSANSPSVPFISRSTLITQYHHANWEYLGRKYFGRMQPIPMDGQCASELALSLENKVDDLIGVCNAVEYFYKRSILLDEIVRLALKYQHPDNLQFIMSYVKPTHIAAIYTFTKYISDEIPTEMKYPRPRDSKVPNRHCFCLGGIFNNDLLHTIEIRNRNYSLVSESSFATDRMMEKDECNPLIKLYQSPIRIDFKSYRKTMINNLTLFKDCFNWFTSSVLSNVTWGEIDGCRVVCAGGAVLGSLTCGSKSFEEYHETYLLSEQAIATLPLVCRKQIQEYLSYPTKKAISEARHQLQGKIQLQRRGFSFSEDGLTVDPLTCETFSNWYTSTQLHYNSTSSPYFNSDIDLFLITKSKESATERIKQLVKEITVCLPCSYHIVKTTYSLTILPTVFPYRPIQIVTATLQSYYEFILKADIDCTCFIYDGDHVYTHLRAIQSFYTSTNRISPRLLEPERSRMIKYAKRDYSFEATDLTDQIPGSSKIVEKRLQYCTLDPTPQFMTRIEPNIRFYLVGPTKIDESNDQDDLDGPTEIDIDPSTAFELDESTKTHVDSSATVFDLDRFLETDNMPKLVNPNFAYHGWNQLDRFVDQHIHTQPKSVVNIGVGCYQCGALILHHRLVDPNQIAVCKSCKQISEMKWKQWDSIKVDQNNAKYALVTGARMKVGYYIALRLLKSGFTVMVTTRFPWIAIDRYSMEDGYSEWKDRLFVYGCDFRHLPSVQSMINHIKQLFPRLDILINNAAQTIRRPRAYFRELIEKEEYLSLSYGLIGHITQSLKFIKNGDSSNYNEIPTPKRTVQLYNNEIPKSIMECSLMTQIQLLDHDREERNDKLFPEGCTDLHGEPLDKREQTTWRETIEETSPIEMMEVQLVNVTVPFMLISQLSPIMSNYIKTDGDDNHWKFIVNVSAQEGSFNKGYNHGHHTHTNMAKSSLNMMTYSIAESYLKKGIYVCGVDTGWCTKMTSQLKDGPESPLNEFDGAARVLDPIASILLLDDDDSAKRNKMHVGGMFCHFKAQDNVNYSGSVTRNE
ncbi:putative short-chain dehydrogenase [Cavenderia fasciculata]|uniref:Short-chain dehydrogenase n=1 Tax=Cavenderia fasciculata TaxID=261658 RepID=F4PRY3_CACFS|nr:putative short-chain dehydrogenase [Cavenderia fasciculata]EGG21419.1 putative short-chain dehydrogenase [Cavenderia fasciculata]|eukprot:XP_004359269.1 putative short-chain dehydrogenase [Cavenderia fasciculata]